MVKTVSIAEYQAAKTAGDDPTMVDRIYDLNIQTVDPGDALGLVKGKVRQAVEEAGLPASDDDISAAAEGIWAQLGRPGATPTREHTYTVDQSGEVRDWRTYSKRPAATADTDADGDGEPGVTHHRITDDDEPRFSGAGAEVVEGEISRLIPTDASFLKRDFQAAPGLANLADELIERHGFLSQLENCRLEFKWQRKGANSKGKRSIGALKRVSGVWMDFCDAQFIVYLAADTARLAGFTDRQVEAALFHQLLHIDRDAKGNWIKVGHDFEGFGTEVRHYGPWTEDLKIGSQAFTTAVQLGLDLDDEDEDEDDEHVRSRSSARAARGDGAGVLIHPDGTPLTDEEIAEQEAAEARGEFDDEWDDDEEDAQASRAMSAASGIADEDDDDDAEVVI